MWHEASFPLPEPLDLDPLFLTEPIHYIGLVKVDNNFLMVSNCIG